MSAAATRSRSIAGGCLSPAALLLLDGLREVACSPPAARELTAALAAVPGLAEDILRAAGLDGDPWLDSHGAAAHVGQTVDAFDKVCHRILHAQEGPGCKRYWRRSTLDAWRLSQVAA